MLCCILKSVLQVLNNKKEGSQLIKTLLNWYISKLIMFNRPHAAPYPRFDLHMNTPLILFSCFFV